MDKFINYLEQLEHVSGRLEKEEILYQMLINAPDSAQYLQYVFDGTIYGISEKSIEKAASYDPLFNGIFEDSGKLVNKCCNGQEDIIFNSFSQLLDKIKQSSGNQQIGMLTGIFNTYKPLHCKWFVNCLLKNMHNGVSLKTVNNALKKASYNIVEKFEVQLCGSVSDIKKFDKPFPVIGGIKYDGFRAIIEKIGNNVVITSRQGKEVTFVPEITESMKKINFDFIIDGEIMADNFNLIQKRIGRKAENIEPVTGLHFRVFDILSLRGESVKDKAQEQRMAILTQEFDSNDLFQFEESKLISNQVELESFYKLACDREEEGIIIKILGSSYDYGSRKNWLKVKPIFENTFKIIGFELGKGKHTYTIGAVTIVDESGVVSSNVGSGLTDDNRAHLLNLSKEDNLIGRFVDIQYNEITQNSKGEYSLRFPRFLKLRDDKNKADSINLIKNI